MSLDQQLGQILWEAYDDGCRRLEAELWRFVGPLNEWVSELLKHRLPADWRARMGAYLDTWEPEGFEVAPDERVILEEWIHAWAELRGLLPLADGPATAQVETSPADEPFVMAFAPNASGPPESGGTGVAPTGTFVNGIEVAGPGPEVTPSYKAKVQQALDVLDPKVGNWWQANSVRGQVRAKAFWVSNYESHLEANDLPVIVVDQNYTAGQTAQAIIAEVSGGWFADSIGVYYKKYKFARKGDYQEFLAWQQGAVGEAARLASVLAELYVNGIATLTAAGDLVVTLGGLADKGPHWEQLLSTLPLVGHLPIGAIVLKLGNREIKLPKVILNKFEKLDSKQRRALLAQAAAAKTDEEAAAIIKQGIGHEHHIATSRNTVSALRGGPWTQRFEDLFKKAGMTLEDAVNKVRLPGHKGPHPEEYHREIYLRLSEAVGGLNGDAYTKALVKELESVALEVKRPGTKLNRLLTQ